MANKNKKILVHDLNGNIFAEFGRGIKLGFTNLWRNRLLSLATILVMAIMICIFNSILAVNFISRQALQNINQKVDLIFYLKDGTDYYSANLLTDKIKDISGVISVNYISKEQALAIVAKSYPQTTDFFQKFNLKNPLPASISVTTESAEIHQKVYDFLATSPLNQYLENSQETPNSEQNIISNTAANLINLNQFIKQLIFWVVFVFIIGGSLIIINAIQLTIFTRRNEIFIMRLVGATPNFIRLPFITEAITYAVIAVIVSFFLLYGAGQALEINNLTIFKDFQSINLVPIFLSEIGLSTLLGLISSFFAVEKYLHGKLVFN